MLNRVLRLIALVAIAGCATIADPSGPPPQLTQLPRDLSADELRVAGAANQFTFSLFRQLAAAHPDSNVFVSPLSVTMALGMTMNGANGQTLDEMRATLGFGDTELPAINDGYRALMSLEGGLDPSATFRIANSVWHVDWLPVSPEFVNTVKDAFQAEVHASPFDQTTVTQVNEWVSAQTNGKIPTILDGIDPDLVMFLINAIYFKGSWREQFDPARTFDGTFNALGGAQTVKTMRHPEGEAKVNFAVTPEATIGELAYGNSAFVFTVLMPNQGDVNALAASLDTTRWSALTSDMHETGYEVTLPKLKLAWEATLNDDLQALGMRVAFDANQADFSRMLSSGSGLYISFVKHKTFVNIDEEGTEAAAVTNVGMGITSLPPAMRVDRPFIFAIRERFSGTILFMGKIVRIP